MARLALAEMDHVNVSGHPRLTCTYCHEQITYLVGLTLADLVTATTQHKTACPSWPSPRSRTAQCRPMAGQMAIPLPR